MTAPQPAWTNPSVLALGGEGDPIDTIVSTARAVVLDAVDRGWDGPPYDPFELARLMDIPMLPRQTSVDARTVPTPDAPRGVAIEYNPTRPAGRVRFSIAHELGHTLFPDVATQVRHRTALGAVEEFADSDDWQLEMLCNLAASEFLMPSQSLEELGVVSLAIKDLMAVRKRYDVSTEALLRRVVSLTTEPVTMFAARRVRHSGGPDTFVLDYAQASRTSTLTLSSGFQVPDSTRLSELTAVGFTTVSREEWLPDAGQLDVQAVGLPPYPGHSLPRAAGLLRELSGTPETARGEMREVVGDVLQPRGEGPNLILHIGNDRAVKWAGHIGSRLARRYPVAARSYTSWATYDPANLHLGAFHIARALNPGDPDIGTLVAQEGFGASAEPRIRYPALAQALEYAAHAAIEAGYRVHAPRLGTGGGGGHWDVIRDQIDRALCRRGVDVTVYQRFAS